MVPLKPSSGATVTVDVPELPAATVRFVAVSEKVPVDDPPTESTDVPVDDA